MKLFARTYWVAWEMPLSMLVLEVMQEFEEMREEKCHPCAKKSCVLGHLAEY